MSDARYSSSDIPNFDTYPSSTPQVSLPPADSPRASLPEGVPFDSETRSGLEIRAARLGTALGQFVLLLRNKQQIAQQKLSVMSEEATAALNQTADSVKVRAGEAGQVASNKAQEMWTEAERRADQLRHRANHNLKLAKIRAQEIQRDNPERVAIGAGALGVALGIGLRIWRANRV
jgi:hypothetical protein